MVKNEIKNEEEEKALVKGIVQDRNVEGELVESHHLQTSQ
jgi:hypothetical protein